MAAFLGRTRYQRVDAPAGLRNGHRPRRIQASEGELTIEVPRVRDSLVKFVSRVIPDTRTIARTRHLEALVIGAYVRGLSDPDIEDLARGAGLRPAELGLGPLSEPLRRLSHASHVSHACTA